MLCLHKTSKCIVTTNKLYKFLNCEADTYYLKIPLTDCSKIKDDNYTLNGILKPKYCTGNFWSRDTNK